MATKRIFVSIDLPTSAKEELRLRQKPEIPWIKLIKLDNLHITLNFLGDLQEEQIEIAKSVIQEVIPYYQSFSMSLIHTRAERDMLWLVPAENEALDKLRAELKAKFKERRAGKRERRPYTAHILFAKSKTGRPMLWQPDKFEPIEFAVNKINLYESKLTPGAATHILMQSFDLSPALSPAPGERGG